MPKITAPFSIPVDTSKVSKQDIEKMLFFIASLPDSRYEARRFNKLSAERKRKVVVVLKKRQKRAQRVGLDVDRLVVREILDDAQRDIFLEC